MVERNRIRLLTGAVASVVLSGLSGCVVAPYDGPPPPGYPPYYYDYYYYPHAGVYFHLYSGWYYYHDHDRWRRVRRLPPHIRLNQRYRRLLKIPEQDPWRRHTEHRRKYPPPALRPEKAPDGDRPTRRPPAVRDGGRKPRAKPAPAPKTPRAVPPPSRIVPPAARRQEREHDREEREHNKRRYDEYRRKRQQRYTR